MEIIKGYRNYKEFRNQLKRDMYNFSQDSIGQWSKSNVSVDLTVRNYDNEIAIDYDVYIIEGANKEYYDGGKVCSVNRLPFTEKEFWELVEKEVTEFLKTCKEVRVELNN